MQMFPKSRAGAVKLATPLMILCFLAMGGFLYWLSTGAAPEDGAVDEDGVALNEVALQEFIVGTQAYMGEEITLRGVAIHATIGTGTVRHFWTTLVDVQDLYLLFTSESALADSVDVRSVRRVDITGRVMPLSDSVFVAWAEAGVFSSDGDRAQAEFALDKGDYFEILRFEMEGGVGGSDEADESGESDEEDPPQSGDPAS